MESRAGGGDEPRQRRSGLSDAIDATTSFGRKLHLRLSGRLYHLNVHTIAKLAVVHFDMFIVHSGILLVHCGTRGRSVLLEIE
jgi:hypothetical protein